MWQFQGQFENVYKSLKPQYLLLNKIPLKRDSQIFAKTFGEISQIKDDERANSF